MPTPKRTLITAGVLGLMLAVAACSKSDQQKTQANVQATTEDMKSTTQEAGGQVKADVAKLGEDVKQAAHKSGADLKAISKDPEVKKAAGELKGSLKDLGKAVKEASKRGKSDNSDEPEKK